MIETFLGIGGASYALHREEMVVVSRTDCWEYFWEIFLEGANYAQSYNKIIAIMAVGILVIGPIWNALTGNKKCSRNYFLLLFIVGLTWYFFCMYSFTL